MNNSQDASTPVVVESSFPQNAIKHLHDGDVRVGITATLFVLLLAAVAVKTYFAQAVGFKDTCSLDQHFDPIISGIGGALTTIIGFYFGERRRHE